MQQVSQQFTYKTLWGGITLQLRGGVCHGIRLEADDTPACPKQHPVAQWLDSYFSDSEDAVLPD